LDEELPVAGPGFTRSSRTFISSVNLAAQLVDRLLAFAQVVIIAAIFGAGRDADLFFLASIVPLTIGYVTGEPLGRATLTLIVGQRSERDQQPLAASTFLLAVGALVSLSALYLAITLPIVDLAFRPSERHYDVWLALALIAPALGISGYLAGLLTWVEDYTWAAARFPLQTLSGLLGIAIVWSAGVASITNVALALGSGYVVAALVMFARVSGSLGQAWPLAASRASIRVASGIRRLLVGPTLGGLVGGQVLVLAERLLATGLGTGSVAVISYARGIAAAPSLGGWALGAGVYPDLVRAEAAGKEERVRETVAGGLRLAIMFGGAFAVFFALFGQQTVSVLLQHGSFGSSSSHSAGLVLVAFAGSTFSATIVFFLTEALYGLGRFTAILRVSAAVFVTYAILAPFLREIFDLRGLAVAFVIAQTIGAGVAASIVFKSVQLGVTVAFKQIILRASLRVGGIAIALACVRAVATSDALSAAATVGIGLVTTFGALVVASFGLPETERLRARLLRRGRVG
jgi:peptidoglycan biosynthesis protein MviN/MurJ (putative lipid II flippase)